MSADERKYGVLDCIHLRSSASIGGYSLSVAVSIIPRDLRREASGEREFASHWFGFGWVWFGFAWVAWVRFGFAFSGGLDLTAPASASADFFA